MNSILMNALPVADWVENITDWFTNTFSGLFALIENLGKQVMGGMTNLLTAIPPLIFIILITALAFYISDKKKRANYFHISWSIVYFKPRSLG